MRKRINVLQVVRAVPGGGADLWLLNVVSKTNRERLRFDFCALWPPSTSFCDEIEATGGRIFLCPFTHYLPTFPFRFRRILRAGSYDVVHSHVGWASGVVLRQASLEGIPVRIAHSHASTDNNPQSLWWKAWRATMGAAIHKYATTGLAVSGIAADFQFGRGWRADSRYRLFRCGIDLEPFRAAPSKEAVRRELGIPLDAPVVGHVGMFAATKNQAFLLEVAEEVVKSRPDARFLMVGEGPLRAQIEATARELGIEKKIVFTGFRSDVHRLMISAMDLFVFPSRWEGFPIALLEAQAAGLRCLVGDAVTPEASVVPGAVNFLPLNHGAKVWASAILEMLNEGPADRERALRILEKSEFDLRQSCVQLARLYEGAGRSCMPNPGELVTTRLGNGSA